MDEDASESGEQGAQRPEGPEGETRSPEGPRGGADLVRVGLYFYGGMLAVALVWRMGFYGESILYASPDAAARGLRPLADLGTGLAAGLTVVAISYVLTAATDWGEALARALGRSLGPIGVPDALLLALASGMAEEALFRGALQPRVGLVIASLVFGCVHFVPRREFLPWTLFAILAGLFFGVLFEWTGNLLAPAMAHFVVNAVNLPLLVRRYGAEAPADGSLERGDEEP